MTLNEAVKWVVYRSSEKLTWPDDGLPVGVGGEAYEHGSRELHDALLRGVITAYAQRKQNLGEAAFEIIPALSWINRPVGPRYYPYAVIVLHSKDVLKRWPPLDAAPHEEKVYGAPPVHEISSVGYDWQRARELYHNLMAADPQKPVKAAARDLRVVYEKEIDRRAPSVERLAVRIRAWRKGS